MQVRHLRNILQQQRVDVICERTLVTTLVAAPAAQQTGVPHISVVVADPRRDLELGAGRFAAVKRRLLRKAYLRADRVVAVSNDLRDKVIDFYALPPDRVVTIRNPIDLERADRLAAQGDPRFDPGRFHVVSAGRFQEQKGYVYLLDAVDELVNVRHRNHLMLHLLGQGPQEQMLRTIVAERNLGQHVRFEGFQPNPFCYFRAADVVCLASLYEGMPNVLLEAMACRTPILATDCPSGPREILDGGRLGELVPPADPAALADAIDDAMTGYAKWSQRVAAARLWLDERFSIQPAVRAMELLFCQVKDEHSIEPSDR